MPLSETDSPDQTPHRGNRFALILATGFGVGFSPVMPGTVGSLWGLLLIWLMSWLQCPWWGYPGMTLLLFLSGIPLCSRVEKRLNKLDPGAIVWDEIAAFPIVFLPLPLLERPVDLVSAVAGFLWFRLFDIWKPWPVKHFDRLHGGLGIMADDLVAGVFAAVALWGTLVFVL